MIIVKRGEGQVIFEPTTSKSVGVVSSLMETIKKKAAPYFERGYTAVTQGRQLRTFEEARDLIYNRIEIAADDKFEDFLWDFAVIMARAYIAGVEAARAGNALVCGAVPMLEEVCPA